MALDPLATKSDLEKRGVDVDSDAANPALAAASAAVRDAANGHPISQVTTTVTLPAVPGCWLRLPSPPVTAVTAVEVGGTDVLADVVLRDGELYRSTGWRDGLYPFDEIVVTYTHGFAEVPADIVDLVCALAAASIKAAADDYAAKTNVATETIDDYRVGYVDAEQAVASVVELPERTKRNLAARFGGGAYVLGSS